MKLLLLKFALLFVLILQAPEKGLDNFIKFTVRNFKPPEAVQRICTWQYAIVKLRVDQDNKIKSVEVLNEVSGEIKESLGYLKQYKFEKNEPYCGHSVIFCLNMENTRLQNCDVIRPKGYTHKKAKDVLKEYVHHNVNLVKDAVILYNNFTVYFYEPVN